jgi:FAD/FMN-containing dehydrogenase
MKSAALYVLTVSLTSLFYTVSADLAAAQCKTVPGDPNWPEAAKWMTLPNVVARGVQQSMARPDYRVAAKSVEDVQKAVTFAKTNNIRLSVIFSGHDGLGRNDAPTGLVIGTENLKGLRVEHNFTPSAKGAPNVLGNHGAPMRFRRSNDAAQPTAVTIGAGMTTAEVNNKLASQGLFTNGAEHGACTGKPFNA